jgi:hypothetical protein
VELFIIVAESKELIKVFVVVIKAVLLNRLINLIFIL